MYYSFFLENSTISLFIVIKWVRDAECRESLKRGKEKKKQLSMTKKIKGKSTLFLPSDALRPTL